ncbi:hypothetical protein [Micromonospora sp. NBC_01813]|uniref:hypothetical protein n=1 Tax=Micromonospora sp. NBC_01813 TaxID=2975988 RepID=UPI002DD9CD1A|nr:hypothetical protein [Micromonospora sp. NBC_01813]WSA09000.1 hypothetical protein OG958_33410 [Micromonospora sp. NBC_01813]
MELASILGVVLATTGTSMASFVTAWLASRQSRRADQQASQAAEAAAAVVQDLDAAASTTKVSKTVRLSWNTEAGIPANVDDRVTRLTESLREAESIIAELQAEMGVRHAAVARLRAEEEESRQLAALKAEEAKAVRTIIDTAIASAHTNLQQKISDEQSELRARLIVLQKELQKAQGKGRKEQALFFTAGALLSIPIGFLVNAFS